MGLLTYRLTFVIPGSTDRQKVDILVTGAEEKAVLNAFKARGVFQGAQAAANFKPTAHYIPISLVKVSA